METSILDSTKQILGLSADYTAFDLDILTHINSAFSVLNQVGVVIPADLNITDATTEWSELGLDNAKLNLVRTYIYLKVRLVFDPPGTSYLIEAVNKQIEEYEYRLRLFAETTEEVTT